MPMNDFMEMFVRANELMPLHLDIYYSENLGWCIAVWRTFTKCNQKFVAVRNHDMNKAYAEAYDCLFEWYVREERKAKGVTEQGV